MKLFLVIIYAIYWMIIIGLIALAFWLSWRAATAAICVYISEALSKAWWQYRNVK